MAILSIQMGQAGLAGTIPSIIYINTNDTQATIETAGYLNSAAHNEGFVFEKHQAALVYTTDQGPGWYIIAITGTPGNFVYSLQ